MTATRDLHQAVQPRHRSQSYRPGTAETPGIPPSDQSPGFDLSLIVPTRNEAGNIAELWRRIDSALGGLRVECIFVDDSEDETPDQIRALPARTDREVTLIHRERDERVGGLGGAVVLGLKRARSLWAGVMDADLQHPPELLPRLLELADGGRHDLVVASRYCGDGHADGLGSLRSRISRGSTAIAQMVFPKRLNGVTDPMSGFFLVRRAAIDPEALQPAGFKILLEIMVRSPQLRITEAPYRFGARFSGESKATAIEGARYFRQLLASRLGESSFRLVKFGLVGVSGLVVNTLLLAFNAQVLGLWYILAAIVATQGSTLWNFLLTERFVFAEDPAHSWLRRLGLFFCMNNAAFLLRGPIMYTLTTGLHVHYLESNIVSLAALMMLRFTTADRWIWGSRQPDEVETVFASMPSTVQLQEGA
jgi:dolichol-phosphate mannosyltransferase